MHPSRQLILILVFSIVLNLIFTAVPSVNAHSADMAALPSSATKNAAVSHSVDFKSDPFEAAALPSYRGSLADLSVLHRSQPADTSSAAMSSPSTVVSHPSLAVRSADPVNGQDIVYLVNSQQVGRTRSFSASSPSWTPVTGTSSSALGLTTIYDFILDPQDPYHKAWAVGDTGIWRTTNLDAESPAWYQVRSIAQILQQIGPSIDNVALRIVSDASRPDYFLVLLGTSSACGQHWIGWTTDSGGTWSWQPLPGSIQRLLQDGYSPASLAMSQDGTGRIWVGGSNCQGGGETHYTAFSANYGQNWTASLITYQGPFPPNPTSLYFSHGTLFVAIGSYLAKSTDNGVTWNHLGNAVPASTHLPYGISGLPQTDQLVYYTDDNGGSNPSLQYSVDGGTSFTSRSTLLNAFPASGLAGAVTTWLDNPNRMAWTNIGPCAACNSQAQILAYSSDGGSTWQNKTGDWTTNTAFGQAWFGATGSSGSDGNVFVLIPSQVAALRDLALKGKLCDCNISHARDATNFANDPIDTSNGNLSYQVTDISVPSLGGNLSFQRSYASSSNSTATELGYGWVSNFDTHIVAPITTTPPLTVALQSSNGSQLVFFHTNGGNYAPDFGVTAQLSQTVAGYTLTDKSQTVYTFNITGSLTSKRDPLGRVTTYSYTLPNTLTQVTDVGTGRWLRFNYSGGNLSNVSDNSGRSITFTYNLTGDLASLIDLRGLTWTYTYTGTHLLWKVTDPDIRTVIRTEYDSQGRAIQQFDGTGNKTVELTFGSSNAITLTDALGHASTDTYVRGMWANSANAAGSVITRNYDLNFRPTYLADANGNGTQMIWSPDGNNLQSVTYSPQISISQKFDALNNLTQATDARGFTTTYAYSGTLLTRQTGALGNTSIYTYGQSNLLVAQQDALRRVTQYSYDNFGQRIAVTDPSNNVTRYGYDTIGRLISTTVNVGIPGFERTTLSRYDNAGNLISTTVNFTTTTSQPNYLGLYNLTTLYSYDGASHQIAVTDTIGRVARNFYNNAGQLISTTANVTTTSSVPNYLGLYNLITQYGYDPVGNQILVTDTRGLATKTDYDTLNRPITVTQNFSPTATSSDYNLRTTTGYDAAGNVITQTDPLGHVTRTWYDNLNRPVTVTQNYIDGFYDPARPDQDLSTITAYDFAGNGVASRDPLTHTSTFGYDSLNRLISTTNALTGTTRYQYDAVGNRILVTDVLTHATRYEYDILNRLITTTFPYTGYVVNTYDAAGNRTKVTDALGHSTVYAYDIQGRLIAQTDPISGTTRYEYDVLGNRVVMTDALGTVTRYAYDIAGHQLVMTQSYTTTTGSDPDTYNLVTRSRYDLAGNLISTTNPLTATTVYTYDALNRLVEQSDALGRAWSYQYDGLGNRIVITDANLQVMRFYYDAASHVSSIVYPTSTVSYQYDAVGNRTVMTDSLGVSTFRYDGLNRLIGHTNPFSQIITNTYDAYGNIAGLRYPDGKMVSYTFNANNWLTGVRDWNSKWLTYTYDSVGRVITLALPNGVTTGFRYDNANRLTGLTTFGNSGWLLGAYTYTLDAVGNRTQVSEYLGDITFLDYLPTIMNNYSSTQGMAPQSGGLSSPFVSPLAVPGSDTITPFDSPLPTPQTSSLLGGRSSLLSLPASSLNEGAVPNGLLTTFMSPIPPPNPCTGGLPVFGSSVVITYTYDPLRRLTNAQYSSGACFSYNYDPVGNMTQVTETITSTRVTGYTYDVTSRLQTSKVDVESTTWYYRFDSNGNLVEMTPNGSNPGNGAIRYSYDTANHLNKVESYASSAYTVLAQMGYDGLGNRARLIAWAAGVPLTTTYATRIAGQVQILEASSGSVTTAYLYGLSPLGEFGSQSVYYLTDGTGSVRQLADPNGAVKLARIYEPFGQILLQKGAGDAVYGYLGAQVDRITGLLYLNGRYYDPITGRFLTPSGNEQNPYVPLAGAALAPILIVVLLGRKKKGQLWTGWLVLAVMASVGLGLAACGGGPTPTPTAPAWPPSNPQDIVAKAQSLVGSKTWQNPMTQDRKTGLWTYNDFYSYFVLGLAKSNIQTMNCWEMYLYTRHEIGNIDASWIKSFYHAANLDDYKIWEQLGAFNAKPLSQVSPTLGSLIFNRCKTNL